MQAETNQFSVAHAIGDTHQVVRVWREPISGRRASEVVSTHPNRAEAERACATHGGCIR